MNSKILSMSVDFILPIDQNDFLNGIQISQPMPFGRTNFIKER
jgi:hypothetical protein